MPYFPGQFPPVLGVIFGVIGIVAIIFGGILAVDKSITKSDKYWVERQRIYDAAFDTWLAECKEPRGQCALQWDRSSSLRELYIRRVK